MGMQCMYTACFFARAIFCWVTRQPVFFAAIASTVGSSSVTMIGPQDLG